MTKSDLHLPTIRALAKKWKINSEIRLSDQANKKLMVKVDGKWIHFGAAAYDDFTTHKDERRRNNYCRRAAGIRDKQGNLTGNDRTSPNYYAMRLLWDCAP